MKLRVTLEIDITQMDEDTQRELKRYCPALDDDMFDPSTYTAEDLARCVALHEECMSGTDVFVEFGNPKVVVAELVDS